VSGWLHRLFGSGVPEGFAGTLAAEENVLGSAEISGGGQLVATSLGLWIPDGGEVRRLGWHLISKTTWSGGALSVIEAAEEDTAGEAVLIADRPPRRFVLERPGPVPRVVQARVTGSIRSRHHHELPGGGAWFVQRKVSGEGRIVLQVRADPGTDLSAVRRMATEVAERIRVARGVP
jgi:hypothetical protein